MKELGSEQILAFISAKFRSAWALELLALLRSEHGRSYHLEELVRMLCASRLVVEQSVTALVDGPSRGHLRSSAVQTLALALHELGTNAVKYGALAQASGFLTGSWRLCRSDDGKPWLDVD